MRSSNILPRFVYLKKKKIASTSTAMPAEPKADRIPIKMPFPVDPALMFMTTGDSPGLPGCEFWPKTLRLGVDEVCVTVLEDDEAEAEVENVEG